MPHLHAVAIDGVTATARGVAVTAHCSDVTRDCPACGVASRRVHGRYERTLVDVPPGCREVVVRLTVRRFRCANPLCSTATFVEQVPGLTSRWARRTQPVTAMLTRIGLVLAGRAGARLADGLGVGVGRNVLLRILRALPIPGSHQGLRLVGIDDFALRRGHVYGTVLVDLDTHRPVDLLPERTADPVAAWLRARPGIEVVCRDRAGAYAQAATDAVPDAVQVADRWHLWHNLAQHVEHATAAHRRCWSTPPTPAEATAESTGEPAGDRCAPATDSVATEHVDPPVAPGAVLEARPTIGPGRLAARNAERWQLVHGLLAEGLSLKAISRRTGLARGTVRRFGGAQDPAQLDRGPRPLRGSSLDAHRDYLAQQWRAGNTNAADLLRQLRERGYQGSSSSLREYVRPWRTTSGTAAAPPRRRSAVPTTRDVTRWICTRPDDLDAEHATALATVLGRCEHLERLTGHVRAFAGILTTLAGDRLNAWINAVQNDVGQPQLMSFVRGLLADYDAVRAGLTLAHNSGPVEGNVTRIKMIKGKMYGRANFDLLRTLVVLGP